MFPKEKDFLVPTRRRGNRFGTRRCIFLVPTRRRGNRFGTRRCIFWFPRAGVGTDLGRAGVRFGGLAARDAGMSRMRSHAGAWEREIFLIDCRVTLFHYVQ